MQITQAHLDEIRRIGACENRVAAYNAGMDFAEIEWPDAIWVEIHAPHLVADLYMPLWAQSKSGYGHGYGSGYGHGYGCGDGSGDGDGDG